MTGHLLISKWSIECKPEIPQLRKIYAAVQHSSDGPMVSRSKEGVPELRRIEARGYDGVQAHPSCFYSPLAFHVK